LAQHVVQWPTTQVLGIAVICLRIVSSHAGRGNNSPAHETILGFSRRIPETSDGYQATNEYRRKAEQGNPETSQMRTVSFLLAFAFVVAGSSMAGSVESGLPGVGTFSYNGTPVAPSQTLIVAVR
jgi:hypothetical protein